MSIAPPKTAMVLAAGLGRRMLPLTEHTPKPLVKVAGKPLIDHVLDRLAGQGVERAVVNVHHYADQMRAHLANYQKLEVVISDETAGLLDSCGGILKALPLLGAGPYLIVNSDLILLEDEPSVSRLADFFDPARMDFLMLLAPALETTGFDGPGDFHHAPNGVLSWRAPCEKAHYMNTGTQIIGAHVFDGLAKGAAAVSCSVKPLWHKAADSNRFYGLPIAGRALHVGDPAGRDSAELVLSKQTDVA